MILADVNVLINAFRKHALDHDRYREWLDGVVNSQSAYGVSPQVLSSFIRISTHPGIFARPSQLGEALAFCQVLMEQEHCQLIQTGPRHWSIFTDLCRRSQACGNLVQDAWFAALAIEHGCEWITTDRDYSRFPGLRWRLPF
jgi:toxin-antitoxin system PIN domain toxin